MPPPARMWVPKSRLGGLSAMAQLAPYGRKVRHHPLRAYVGPTCVYVRYTPIHGLYPYTCTSTLYMYYVCIRTCMPHTYACIRTHYLMHNGTPFIRHSYACACIHTLCTYIYHTYTMCSTCV